MPPAASRLFFGKKGEEQAVHFLKKLGFSILEKNWRCRLGEMDLIAKDRGTLVFIEVKSRSHGLQEGLEAVNYSKQKKLHRLALAYLKYRGLPLETEMRFDVAVVLADGSVHHVPAAFCPSSEL